MLAICSVAGLQNRAFGDFESHHMASSHRCPRISEFTPAGHREASARTG